MSEYKSTKWKCDACGRVDHEIVVIDDQGRVQSERRLVGWKHIVVKRRRAVLCPQCVEASDGQAHE